MVNLNALEIERDLRHDDYSKAMARLFAAVKLCGTPTLDDTPLQRSARNAARGVAERWLLYRAAAEAYEREANPETYRLNAG